MKAPRFTKWFAALPALNQPQRLKVLDALHPAAGLHELLALLERTTCATRRCPHCRRELDCILVARDRGGQTLDAVTGRGALSKAQLKRHLLPYLDPQVLLVTDANAAYRAFAREHRIAHQSVNLSAGVRMRRGAHGAIHVQNVHAYHRRLRDWLAPFHGVASRYLPNYLGWRRMLDGGKVTSADQLFRLAIRPIHTQR